MSPYDFDPDEQIKKHRNSENLFGIRTDPITGSIMSFPRLQKAGSNKAMGFSKVTKKRDTKPVESDGHKVERRKKDRDKTHRNSKSDGPEPATPVMMWAPEEKEELRSLFLLNNTVNFIAEKMNRSQEAVISELKRMRIYNSSSIKVDSSLKKGGTKTKSGKKIPVNHDINPQIVDEYIEVIGKINELQEWKDELREEILKHGESTPKMHAHGNKHSIRVYTYERLDIPSRKDPEKFDRFKALLIDTDVYEQVSLPNKTLLRDMLKSNKIGNFAKARINSMVKKRKIRVITKMSDKIK